jgi:hypothetical protein
MMLMTCIRWSIDNDAQLEVRPLPLGGVMLLASAKGLVATCHVPEDAQADELLQRYRQVTRMLAVRVGARQMQARASVS